MPGAVRGGHRAPEIDTAPCTARGRLGGGRGERWAQPGAPPTGRRVEDLGLMAAGRHACEGGLWTPTELDHPAPFLDSVLGLRGGVG